MCVVLAFYLWKISCTHFLVSRHKNNTQLPVAVGVSPEQQVVLANLTAGEAAESFIVLPPASNVSEDAFPDLVGTIDGGLGAVEETLSLDGRVEANETLPDAVIESAVTFSLPVDTTTTDTETASSAVVTSTPSISTQSEQGSTTPAPRVTQSALPPIISTETSPTTSAKPVTDTSPDSTSTSTTSALPLSQPAPGVIADRMKEAKANSTAVPTKTPSTTTTTSTSTTSTSPTTTSTTSTTTASPSTTTSTTTGAPGTSSSSSSPPSETSSEAANFANSTAASTNSTSGGEIDEVAVSTRSDDEGSGEIWAKAEDATQFGDGGGGNSSGVVTVGDGDGHGGGGTGDGEPGAEPEGSKREKKVERCCGRVVASMHPPAQHALQVSSMLCGNFSVALPALHHHLLFQSFSACLNGTLDSLGGLRISTCVVTLLHVFTVSAAR